MKTNRNNSNNNTNDSQATTLSKLPSGEWFTLKQNPNAKVYRKYDYDRSIKKYCCTDVCDAGGAGRLLKGSTIVFFGFTY
jgi:hypothetical protein